MTAPFLAACHSGLIFNSSCGCSAGGGGGGGAPRSKAGFLAGGGLSSNPGGGGWSEGLGLGGC